MVISSLENKHIKEIMKLKQKKYRDSSNTFLAEGYHLVEEALKEGLVKEIVLLEDISYDAGVPVTYVTDKVMKKLSDLGTYSEIIAIVNKKKNKKIGNNVIILEAIQDPGNLGTIIRSANAFNVNTIILGEKCADLYSDKVIRATQGMLFHVDTIVSKNLKEDIANLKDNDYLVLGTRVDDGTDIRNVSYNGKIAIIIGNEGRGMSEEVSNACDDYLYIKMNKNCESLNAAVACSILMYEVFNK